MSSRFPVMRSLPQGAKWAFSTRRVDRAHAISLERDVARAVTGDLVLGRVGELGSHRRLQLASGRPADLYEGDLVVLAAGDRYASDQFEGIARIDPSGADLLAGGGVVGALRDRHQRMGMPTRILPLGLLAGVEGQVLNLADYALPPLASGPRPWVVGVVGSAMNAGKTTAVAGFIRGLARAGYAVAGLKATGTGAFGDVNAYTDAGARFVGDFTDMGMVSTYRQPLERIEGALEMLLAHAAASDSEVAVVELADGVFQAETAALLRSPKARRLFDGFLFAAGDPLAAVAGVQELAALGLEPAATTGLVSRSPLAAAEAEKAGGVPVVSREALLDPARANALLADIRIAAGADRRASA
jgi:hypothetical protein